MNDKAPIRVAVTGAAGQIGYSLLFRIASGAVFGSDQPVALNLIEIEPGMKALEGVCMELDDCAFPLLKDIRPTCDLNKGFDGANWSLLVGSVPRKAGMERGDLLGINGKIFTGQGKAIQANAASDARVLVVGNPCNTNCLIAMNNAPDVPRERWFAMTRLDENRAAAQLAAKAGVQVSEVSNVTIWGNHSATQYPDVSNTLINNNNEKILSLDDQWISEEFIPRVQNRGAEIIEHRGKSSAASAASAIYDHIYALVNGSSDWESMGIMSSNTYDIDDQIFFSYPLNIKNGEIKIIDAINISERSMTFIKNTERELISERDIIKDLL